MEHGLCLRGIESLWPSHDLERPSAFRRRRRAAIVYDMLIAGHALSLDATLVTNNVDEFRRVEGLLLENWAD